MQLAREEEADELDLGIAAIEALTDRRPRGYRSPAWDLSENTVELLLERGFVYDSSMMGHDTQPYRVRRGDVIHEDKASTFGEETDLLELPVSWSADGLAAFRIHAARHARPQRHELGAGELAGRFPLHGPP